LAAGEGAFLDSGVSAGIRHREKFVQQILSCYRIEIRAGSYTADYRQRRVEPRAQPLRCIFDCGILCDQTFDLAN
jgi:hypothetical protein